VGAGLVEAMKRVLREFYGEDPAEKPGLWSHRQSEAPGPACRDTWDRPASQGGQIDPEDLYLAPTILTDVAKDSPVTQEEIFRAAPASGGV